MMRRIPELATTQAPSASTASQRLLPALMLIAGLAFASSAIGAENGFPVSCVTPEWPAVGPSATAPGVATWRAEQTPRDWVLPSCAGWEVGRFQVFTAVVGAVDAPNLGAIAEQIGAISTYKGIRYWSIADGRLEVLIRDAFAVEGSDDRNRRVDFTLADMQTGHDLFFVERDNRSSSPILYQMRIVERNSEQLVIDIENVDSVSKMFVTLFEPGDLRTTLFVSHTSAGVWQLYALSGARQRAFVGLMPIDRSQTNRLIALYAHSLRLEETALPWKR